MKVIHAAYMKQPVPGVVRQMELEQLKAQELGITWHSRIYGIDPSESWIAVERSGSKSGSKLMRFDYFEWLKKVIVDYDVLVLRHIACDPLEVLFARSCSVPIFTVHHTKEIDEVKSSGSLKGYVKAIVESILGARVLNSVTGVIAVTPEIGEWELDRFAGSADSLIVYPNAGGNVKLFLPISKKKYKFLYYQ